MAKACLNKLTGNIVQGCTISQNGIKNIYLMYPGDVTFTLGAGQEYISGAVFAGSARSYLVEGYKQNIQVTTSARTMDASLRLDYSLSFKIPQRSTWPLRAFSTGRFYVMVEYLSGFYSMLGVTCPLECSGIEGDSNANSGMFTVTLSAPEGSAGNHQVEVLTEAKNTIISKSV
nr:MAG TPA: hypothetical protein [Caudoviricetes sp.]